MGPFRLAGPIVVSGSSIVSGWHLARTGQMRPFRAVPPDNHRPSMPHPGAYSKARCHVDDSAFCDATIDKSKGGQLSNQAKTVEIFRMSLTSTLLKF